MREADKNVCLAFDEMDLDAKYSYNHRLKMMIPPAKKLQVVMIRGIVKVVNIILCTQLNFLSLLIIELTSISEHKGGMNAFDFPTYTDIP